MVVGKLSIPVILLILQFKFINSVFGRHPYMHIGKSHEKGSLCGGAGANNNNKVYGRGIHSSSDITHSLKVAKRIL